MSSLYPTGIRHCVRNGDTEVLAISVLATFAVSFVSYQVLVRNTLVGRFLNGNRVGAPTSNHRDTSPGLP